MLLTDIQMLQLEITSHCNLKCPQCSRISENGDLAEFIELKNWDIKKILPNLQIDQLTNLKLVAIEGNNGDAMMHPHIETILDFFYNSPAKPLIAITTNGSMRSPAWWSKLGAKYSSDRLRIQFSLDGLDDTYSTYRVGGIYKNVINNAKAFNDAGGGTMIRTIIFKHNQHQIEEMVQTCKNLGFKQLIFIPNDKDRFKGQETWPVVIDGTTSHSIESTTLDDVSKYNYNNFKMPVLRFIKNNKELCPNFEQGRIYISYKGYIIPCCAYHTDLDFDHPSNYAFQKLVGDYDQNNLHNHLLSEIINDTKFYSDRFNKMLVSPDILPKCDRCLHPDKYSKGYQNIETITIKKSGHSISLQ